MILTSTFQSLNFLEIAWVCGGGGVLRNTVQEGWSWLGERIWIILWVQLVSLAVA